MGKPGRRRRLRIFVSLLAVSLAGFFGAPARAFFFPPMTPAVATPSTPVPIVVPTLPPQITPPTTPVVTPTDPVPPPDTAPEPTSLVTALLGSAGLGLFAAYRRRLRARKSVG